jgi:membrane peptidoglycan carboxypeptidase
MMLNVVQDGTGRKAAISGHDIGGKTGTINDDKSATFVGITPDYAVSVMYFNPKTLEDVGGHGGGIPAQIFHDAMTPILANQPNAPFPPADPAVAAGTRGTGYASPAAPAPAPTPAPTDTQPPAEQPATPAGGGNPGGGRGGGNGGGNN